MKELKQNRLMLAGVLVFSAMTMIGLVDNLIKYIARRRKCLAIPF